MILLALVLLLSSCQPTQNDPAKRRFNTEAVNEAINFIVTSKEGNHLQIVGSGGSFKGREIHNVSISAFSTKEVTVQEARRIALYLSKGQVEQWNQSEFLRSYTVSGEFGYDHVDLGIGFKDSAPEDQNIVTLVICNQGGIFYKKITQPDRKYIIILHETWEEAIARAEPMNEVNNPTPSFQPPRN